MSPRDILAAALKEKRFKLLEHEAFQIIKYYGIPSPEVVVVKSPAEAVELADKIGYPIALKIVSPDITHKSDVGGVKLGLKSREEVGKAVEEMLRTVSLKAPNARLVGVLMYNMAPQGLEVIVGGVRDGIFGPVIMFGLGGIFVEVLKDVSFRIAPITRNDALGMLNEIKSSKILEGYRGQPPVDKEAIADIIVKTARLMEENPEIESIDLNPVMAYPKGAIAVDARIILKQG
ncbi:acetate--CoA ligase family protein [Desulfurococcus amylolyticus]|uniref:AcdB acetate--coA ligase (ADP-forming), beta chain n=1 Tax=Desulfurococcus amylolyticus (strain DSM 18924 / JCM 16383 / VKM B-2413 / 1221n) TaxID=490899 RepID=B8D574_DESA1|nr:acetate--CoA ligase family protein [Desulfurococcus amylolyticus]ACL11255.1 AcdB acetate--coA ligase (ADP-forming), beta chain [Desulfurococcus amylolyticus 1221n]